LSAQAAEKFKRILLPTTIFISNRHRFHVWCMHCQFHPVSFHHVNNKTEALSDMCDMYSIFFSEQEAMMHLVAVDSFQEF
jgi:hypothetical protein